MSGGPSPFYRLNLGFTIVFTVELGVNMFAHWFRRFFCNWCAPAGVQRCLQSGLGRLRSFTARARKRSHIAHAYLSVSFVTLTRGFHTAPASCVYLTRIVAHVSK